MFHTFETANPVSPQTDISVSSAAKRRTSTVRACEPCRRRKIRCNGELPCETCQWYKKTASCHYTEPRQRQMPSKRSVEKISQTLQDYRAILQKLFPNAHPEQLMGLSRERLMDLVSKNSPFQPPSPLTPGSEDRPPIANPEAGSLEQLQPLPEDTDEGLDTKTMRGVPGITDDVNALSLSVKQSSSYLGISSVMAALRVIFWLDPSCQAFVTKTPEQSHYASRENTSPPETREYFDSTILTQQSSSAWNEIPLINAYFQYIHPFVPLIDEAVFRDTYMHRQRTDTRWLLLLNTVLAMGSMANGNSEDTGHTIYFAKVKEHLDVETFGSPHTETLRALAILGGLYLHYIQEPNLANAIMGAALRMSTMLGLHRDFSEGVGPTVSKHAASSIETRRRVWWSIFILDAWAGNTLGRPSMGRMSHAITTKPPQESMGGSAILTTLMHENVRFCIISTRLEDSLAWSPLMDETERQTLDDAFVEWFADSSVRNPNTSPRSIPGEQAGITVLKNVMRWRYLSSRIILHRPILLWYAMRKMLYTNLSDDKRAAIETCRAVTANLITDICTTWQAQAPCQMAGWNAVWLLYQAVMVPLLSLFSDPVDTNIISTSRALIEMAMSTFIDLQPWSSTAKRSLEVVSRIFEASRRHSPEPQLPDYSTNLDTPTASSLPSNSNLNTAVRPNFIDLTDTSNLNNNNNNNTYPQNNAANAQQHYAYLTPASQEVFMDNMFDSLNWSMGWQNNDYPFGTPGMGWDYYAVNGWQGGQSGEMVDGGDDDDGRGYVYRHQ